MRPDGARMLEKLATGEPPMYAAAAWWPMKRQDQDSDPSAVTGGPAAGPSSGGDVPRASFDPPIDNPSVVALLKGLKDSATPEPMNVAMTGGEASAKFVAGPRALPAGHDAETADGPNVVVNPNAGRKKSPAKQDSTFRIRGRRSSLTLPLAVIVIVTGAGIASWLGRSSARPAPASPSGRASTTATAFAPVASPEYPAPPIAETAAPPPLPSAVSSAPPPSTTSPKPPKSGRTPTKGSDELPSVL
jgi:hypothetical protein